MLSSIEKATRKKIEIMELPSTEIINDKRIAKFKQQISDTLANEDLSLFSQLIEQYQQEHNVPAIDIGAALAKLLQGDTPLLLTNKPKKKRDKPSQAKEKKNKDAHRAKAKSLPGDIQPPNAGQDRYRIEVGHNDKVKPGNIVGAIANEAGLESQHIGQIKIFDEYSLVDLPEGMPKEIYKDLKKAWVSGKQLRISLFNGENNENQTKPHNKPSHSRKRHASKRKAKKKKQTH